MTEVAAALIRCGNRFMICRRPEGKKQALLWEFPGGKTEPGESMEEALIRECREELDITVVPRDIFAEAEYAYPEGSVHLTLFNAEITAGVPKKLEHSDIRWVTAEEMAQYDFCPADRGFLEKIRVLK